MSGKEALLAHLQQVREGALGLLRAKLDTVAREIQEAASRLVTDVDLVLPNDPEVLFPLAEVENLVPEPAAQQPPLELSGIRQLDAGRAQAEVLQGLLQVLEPLAGGRAILVFREGNFLGWSGVGFPPEAVRSWHGSLEASPALSRVSQGQPLLLTAETDPVLGGLLKNPGVAVLLVPMSLRGKVVGALLAEEGKGGLAVEWIQFLTYLVGLQLETLAVRPTVPTPSLAPVEDLRPAGEAVGEAPPPFAVEAPPPLTWDQPASAGPAPSPEPAAREGAQLSRPGVDASATQRVEVAPVAPPRSPEEERRHEEARRFARLLVSEIRLYNEQAVQEGKANRDIYARLKEDIDRSREMYEQRIPAEVRAVSDYFYEELVRTLADGDPDALGL
ncbi:MAG: hypothetical protein NZ869_01505 [Thermoanaerobaculum sp.]|nr:hypothetical protein [Thermoanaerobaculum sp.]MDW7968528.1 hypothetical protein [Thermoanaerobaculum sp.]